MKIYTRKGDAGQTGLVGGTRIAKDHARIEAYGTIDELNAALGLARCQELPESIAGLLARLQNELFDIGSELATPDPQGKARVAPTSAEHVAALEAAIDACEADLPPLKEFILPGGSPAAAALHLARTVCRRAERRLVTLVAQPGEQVSPELLRYLNRLSDLLFVLAREANAAAGERDVVWQKRE